MDKADEEIDPAFFSLGLDCVKDDGNLVKSGCKMGSMEMQKKKFDVLRR